MTATGYSFTKNKATGIGASGNIYGGAIYINAYSGNDGTVTMSTATLTNCMFGATTEDTGNSAKAGGAIFSAGSLKVTNCTFQNNVATSNGGGAILIAEDKTSFDASMAIEGATFIANTSIAHGGAIDINGGGNYDDGTADFQ